MYVYYTFLINSFLIDSFFCKNDAYLLLYCVIHILIVVKFIKKFICVNDKASVLLSLSAVLVVAVLIVFSSTSYVDVQSSRSYSEYSDDELTAIGDADVNPSDINYTPKQKTRDAQTVSLEDGEPASSLLDDAGIMPSVGQSNDRYGSGQIKNDTVISVTFRLNDASASDGNVVFKKTEAKIENRANRLFNKIKSDDLNARLISIGKYTVPFVVISAKASAIDAHINDEEVKSIRINGWIKQASEADEARLNEEEKIQASQMRASGIMPLNGRADLTTHALQAWKEGYDGEGINIAIIDTGFDYTHKDFGGDGNFDAAFSLRDTQNPADFEQYVPSKFISGYDFAGSTYCSEKGDGIIVPDANYIVGAGNPHGTHVAGTAAGYGETADGETFTDDYSAITEADLDQTVDEATFSIAPGTAPKTRILGLKVGFDDDNGDECTGNKYLPEESITQSLEYIAQWNLEHDESLKVSAYNMSLGSPLFGSNDLESDIKTILFQKYDVLGVVAAGNDGDVEGIIGTTNSHPFNIIVGATRTGQNVTTKADLYDSEDVLISDKRISGTYSLYYSGVRQLPAVEVKRDDNFDTNKNGCNNFTEAVRGKIVYLQFGDTSSDLCPTSVAYDNAEAAGAFGVIQRYVHDDELSLPGGNSDLPGMFIYDGIGDSLDEIMSSHPGVKVSFNYDNGLGISQNDSLINVPATFTSRGHHGETKTYDIWPEEVIQSDGSEWTSKFDMPIYKPDVSAPGVNIISASAGTGSGRISMSGTSMATPHACGLVALAYQSHPNWHAYEIKADIIETANHDVRGVTGIPYGITRSGSGVVDAYSIVKNKIIFSDYTLNRDVHYVMDIPPSESQGGPQNAPNSVYGFKGYDINPRSEQDAASDRYKFAADGIVSNTFVITSDTPSDSYNNVGFASFGVERSMEDNSIVSGRTFKFEYVPLVQLNGISYSMMYKGMRESDTKYDANGELATYTFTPEVSSIDISIKARFNYSELRVQKDPSRSGLLADGSLQDNIAKSEGYIRATCIEGCSEGDPTEYKLPMVVRPDVRSEVMADRHYLDFSNDPQDEFPIGFNAGCNDMFGHEVCSNPAKFNNLGDSSKPDEKYKSALVPLAMNQSDYFPESSVAMHAETADLSSIIAYNRNRMYDKREDLQSFGVSSTAPQLKKQGKDISKGLLTFGWSFWGERGQYYLGDLDDTVIETDNKIFSILCSSYLTPYVDDDGNIHYSTDKKDMPVCYLISSDKPNNDSDNGTNHAIIGEFPLNSLGLTGEDNIPESRFDTKVYTVSVPLDLLGVTPNMTNFHMRYGTAHQASDDVIQETMLKEYDALDPDIWFEKDNSDPVVSESFNAEHGEAMFLDDGSPISVHRKSDSRQNIMFLHMQNRDNDNRILYDYNDFSDYMNKIKTNVGPVRQADIVWINNKQIEMPSETPSSENGIQIDALGADGYFSSLKDGVIKNGTVWQNFVKNGHKLPNVNQVLDALYDNAITESDVIAANNFSGHYGQGAVLFGNPTNYILIKPHPMRMPSSLLYHRMLWQNYAIRTISTMLTQLISSTQSA